MQNIKAALSQPLITAGTEEIYFAKEEMSNGINAIYNQIWLLHSTFSGLSNYKAFSTKHLLNDVPLNLRNTNFVLDITGTAQLLFVLYFNLFFSFPSDINYSKHLIPKENIIITFLSSPGFYIHITYVIGV